MTILYHRRFGQRSSQYSHKLRNIVKGIPDFNVIPEVLNDCTVCAMAKSSRTLHIEERTRAVRVLELINTDIMGPLTAARTSERFIFTFIDDFSLFSVVYIITKSRKVFKII